MLFSKRRNNHTSELNLLLNTDDIQSVIEFFFLGLYLNSKVNWDTLINVIGKKIPCAVGIIKKLQLLFPKTILIPCIMLWYSHILITVYFHGDWAMLQNLSFFQQKKAICAISSASHNTRTEPLFKICNILILVILVVTVFIIPNSIIFSVSTTQCVYKFSGRTVVCYIYFCHIYVCYIYVCFIYVCYIYFCYIYVCYIYFSIFMFVIFIFVIFKFVLFMFVIFIFVIFMFVIFIFVIFMLVIFIFLYLCLLYLILLYLSLFYLCLLNLFLYDAIWHWWPLHHFSVFVALKSFAVSQPYSHQLLLWDCTDECDYQCMWTTVDAYQRDGTPVPQFHGKVSMSVYT